MVRKMKYRGKPRKLEVIAAVAVVAVVVVVVAVVVSSSRIS
jgi:hypothetical protein